MHDLLAYVEQLADEALLASAHSLVGRERRLTADLVAHVSEMDTRGLHERLRGRAADRGTGRLREWALTHEASRGAPREADGSRRYPVQTG